MTVVQEEVARHDVPSPAAFFPSRLPRIDRDARDSAAERLAAGIGEETIRRLTSEMPKFSVEDAPGRPPGWRSMLDFWKAKAGAIPYRPPGQEPPSPYDEVRVGPFSVPPATENHGGHPPAVQHVDVHPDGWMQIYTRIDDDSSQTETLAFVGVQVLPVFDRAQLTVSPHVKFTDWHPLNATGFGGSHSYGGIGVTILSSALDGSDLRLEGGNERAIWDNHVGGPLGSDGHDINESPDDDGSVTIGQLETQTIMDAERRYFAYPYIRSVSDADGTHFFYASNALVLFDASVEAIFVRQDRM